MEGKTMREILFRGKRCDNGEWAYGNYAFSDAFTQQQHYIFQNKAFDHAVDPDTVGQYTGMKDKNDERIFEGDILRIVLTDGHEDGPIVWSDIDARYHFESPDGCSYGICEWNDLEVIGNVHDNPELLNGGDAG
jgi:hypothetical protein